MQDPIINLITAPDKLLNNNSSVLLVNPSDTVKEQFNHHAKQFKAPINLYLYENIEEQLGWLFEIISAVDYIVLDIDNTKIEQWIIGYILQFDKTFYLTNKPDRLYNVINVNRIFELKQFLERINYFGVE
ncbi:MAG: hypothetical protein CMC89_05235 [Flavobacteriaceae bacterium]|nr:hypothetical protein [Flavobacteriaceae bacterium]|tara:strand:+ start:824 stop:1213 length:390 start_codon:yes stop_codon:yes gene_type:complete